MEVYMRRIFILANLCMCILLLPVSNVWAGDGLKKITDGVYAYLNIKSGSPDNRFGANAGIVIGDKGVLVVDTLTSAKEAEKFLKDIRKITQKPIRYVVNTHYHLDHAFGNCVFMDKGAVIIAHSACRRNMLRTQEKALEMAKTYGMDDEALAGTRIVVPDRAFERSLELDLGNRIVQLSHSGQHSHTDGSIIVSIPNQKIVFAGDILFTDFHPFMGEGDLVGWYKALDDLMALGADKIIPGHGPLSGAKDVQAMKAYLAAFDVNAKKLCSASTDIEKITSEMTKVLPVKSDGEFIVRANLQMRYMPPAPKGE
jgi:glyoxylase-like metal-dependent hydrolase (beta-lactamase superfamily II)